MMSTQSFPTSTRCYTSRVVRVSLATRSRSSRLRRFHGCTTRVSRYYAPATGDSSSSASLRKKSPTMLMLLTHIDIATTFTRAVETSAPFSDLIAVLLRMFSYHFMQNALLAGTIVALVAGIAGYFMVLRGESFAGHSLANIGFA